jgi:hypothetical protein
MTCLSLRTSILGNECHGGRALHLSYFLVGVGYCRLYELEFFRDLYFNLVHVYMSFKLNVFVWIDVNVCTCMLGMD